MRLKQLHFAIKEYSIIVILLCLAICLFISSAFALDSIVNFKKGPEPPKNISKSRARNAYEYSTQKLKDENEEFKKLRFSASVSLIGAFLEFVICSYFLNLSRKKPMYSTLWIDCVLILTIFLICFGSAASCNNYIRHADPVKEKHFGEDWNIRMEILSVVCPLNAIVLLLLIGYLVGKSEEKLSVKQLLREVGPEVIQIEESQKTVKKLDGSSDSVNSVEEVGFILSSQEGEEPEEEADEEPEEEPDEEAEAEEADKKDQETEDDKEKEKSEV